MEASITTIGSTLESVPAEPDVSADFGASSCPALGLKTMKVLRKLKAGQTAVITTDIGGSGKSLWRVAFMTRARIVDTYERDDRFHTVLRKG